MIRDFCGFGLEVGMSVQRLLRNGLAAYGRAAIHHFVLPRNVGALDHADGTGVSREPSTKDLVEVTIAVDRTTRRIRECRFRASGCLALVACGSVLTELTRGLTEDEAAALRADRLVTSLGGLPPHRRYCAEVCVTALAAAVRDAREQREQAGLKTRRRRFVYQETPQGRAIAAGGVN